MIQIIDDQLLGAVLRGKPPPRRRADLFTTGCWYVRLCQAVLGAADRTGVLSKPFASLSVPERDRATHALIELPDTVGLVSWRDLAPLMGRLQRTYDLNVLGLEVLAAAIHLRAAVFLSLPSPRLQAALRGEACRVEVVSQSS